jgi:NADH:ubiquinone oxidoreductase subunit K
MTYKFLPLIFFFLSFYGVVFVRKNLILTLIFIELCFLSLNILLAITSYIFDDIRGQIIIIYIFTLTAIETAVGLALFILYYKMFKSLDAKDFYVIKY